jgi:hypothetical protein
VSAVDAAVDLDDADGLIAADRNGLLRATAMAGAQARATAAALDEGDLESLRSDAPPRTVVWVGGRGTAETAGEMLAAALGPSTAAPIVVTSEAPPWIGALDVLVIAGDDPGDPALVAAAATGVRRGARVVIIAPAEGPLREVGAGRAVSLPPRLWVPDDFGLIRYLAAGLATLATVDRGMRVDLGALADELDAEALRNSPARDLFTNPAKSLADRMTGRRVVLAGDTAATQVLARHGASVALRIAQEPMAAVGLADALTALHVGTSPMAGPDFGVSLFHDEELDGPLPARLRIFALTTDADRPVVLARVSGFDDVFVVNADDVPDAPAQSVSGLPGRPEHELAMMALRLEMAAVYLRLARG